MAFTKLGDEYRDDPRLQEAGVDAIALDVMARIYCTKQKTGGFISAVMLPTICAAVKRPEKVAGRLVDFGLWKPDPAGWWIEAHKDWIPDAQKHADMHAKAKAAAHARWHQEGMPSSSSPCPVVDSSSSEPCVGSMSEEEEIEVEAQRRLNAQPRGSVKFPERWLRTTMDSIRRERAMLDAQRKNLEELQLHRAKAILQDLVAIDTPQDELRKMLAFKLGDDDLAKRALEAS